MRPGRRCNLGSTDAGWSSSVARWAHNPEVTGSNPVPATNETPGRGHLEETSSDTGQGFLLLCSQFCSRVTSSGWRYTYLRALQVWCPTPLLSATSAASAGDYSRR